VGFTCVGDLFSLVRVSIFGDFTKLGRSSPGPEGTRPKPEVTSTGPEVPRPKLEVETAQSDGGRTGVGRLPLTTELRDTVTLAAAEADEDGVTFSRRVCAMKGVGESVLARGLEGVEERSADLMGTGDGTERFCFSGEALRVRERNAGGLGGVADGKGGVIDLDMTVLRGVVDGDVTTVATGGVGVGVVAPRMEDARVTLDGSDAKGAFLRCTFGLVGNVDEVLADMEDRVVTSIMGHYGLSCQDRGTKPFNFIISLKTPLS
jgi:hypothetical protein